jgi:hypothetical protein
VNPIVAEDVNANNGVEPSPMPPNNVQPVQPVEPTSTPMPLQVAPMVPTATPELQIAVVTEEPIVQITPMGFAPTSTPALIVQFNCPNSPASQLQVGMTATTSTNGTLAMRTNLSDPYPSHQVPNMQSVSIIADRNVVKASVCGKSPPTSMATTSSVGLQRVSGKRITYSPTKQTVK